MGVVINLRRVRRWEEIDIWFAKPQATLMR